MRRANSLTLLAQSVGYWREQTPGAAEAVGRSLQLSHRVVLDSAGSSSFGCGAGSNGRHLVTMARTAQALVSEISFRGEFDCVA